MRNFNPITKMDYPDPDVIRVGNTYYMVSTTMYFFPGGAILRSYDLINWEIATYLFDKLDDIPAERLERELVDYAGGMWAPCMRYHEGKFYVIFGSHTDGGRTYLFTASDINGPWERTVFETYYHDCSLLFDDGRAYLVYGNRQIWIEEFEPDMSKPKDGGLKKIIIKDSDDIKLGYEGSHIYKIGEYYYVFMIHWPNGGMRTESCYRSKDLAGEFEGKDVLSDDRGYCGQGVAQGGVVEDPNGNWYGVLFQDSGAVGRIPVLTPMKWVDGWPVFGDDGHVNDNFKVDNLCPDYQYEPLYTSDNFEYEKNEKDEYVIKKQWQWNHQPQKEFFRFASEGGLVLKSEKMVINLTHTVNCLTQRMIYPGCEGAVTIDASNLKDGDVAGICALQSCYGLLGVTKTAGYYYLVKIIRSSDNLKYAPRIGDCLPGEEVERIRLDEPVVKLYLKADFSNMKDMLEFYYDDYGKKRSVGEPMHMQYRLEHFTGYRFGLFLYSTRAVGGEAVFTDFEYTAL